MAVTTFADGVEPVLQAAGWRPGRGVSVEAWRWRFEPFGLMMSPAAEAFLAEFGQLTVGAQGPGVTRYRESFDLDPLLCSGDEDRFVDWGKAAGRSIYPVGLLDGRYCLGIDETAELYVLETWLGTFGTMPGAMNQLVLGYMPAKVRVADHQ